MALSLALKSEDGQVVKRRLGAKDMSLPGILMGVAHFHVHRSLSVCHRRRPSERASLSLSLSLISTTAASTGGDTAAFGPVPCQNQGYDPSIVVQVDLTFGDTEILDDDLRKSLI